MICQYSDNPPSDCTYPPLPPPPSSDGTPDCFSGMNIVEVQDVGYISISKLQIGDYVKSGDGTYTQVYSFGHYHHDAETEFIQIYVDVVPQQQDENHYHPLEISANHLLFVYRGGDELNVNRQVIPASEVIIGDILNDGQIVKSIQYVTRRGLYAPLTQSGDIIVSNVHASNYVNLIHDHHNHWLIWNQHIIGYSYHYPKRLYCKYFINQCQKQTYDINTGYSTGAYYIIQLTSIMNEYKSFGSIIIVSLLSIPLITFVYVIETISMISVYFYFIVICITIMTIIFHIRGRRHHRSVSQ